MTAPQRDRLLALSAEWRSELQSFVHGHNADSSRAIETEKARCADELDAILAESAEALAAAPTVPGDAGEDVSHELEFRRGTDLAMHAVYGSEDAIGALREHLAQPSGLQARSINDAEREMLRTMRANGTLNIQGSTTAQLPTTPPQPAAGDAVLIRQAVARGWCAPENSHKEMDVVLAHAIAREVLATLAPPSEPK